MLNNHERGDAFVCLFVFFSRPPARPGGWWSQDINLNNHGNYIYVYGWEHGNIFYKYVLRESFKLALLAVWAELNRWLSTQKLSGADRSAQTRQVHIKSPRIHLHTPPNPTCSRWYDHEWLKADYKPDSPPHLCSLNLWMISYWDTKIRMYKDYKCSTEQCKNASFTSINHILHCTFTICTEHRRILFDTLYWCIEYCTIHIDLLVCMF